MSIVLFAPPQETTHTHREREREREILLEPHRNRKYNSRGNTIFKSSGGKCFKGEVCVHW